MITIMFDEIIRNLNQDMHEVFDEVEETKSFKKKIDAETYLTQRFGSGILSRVLVFEDGKKTRW